MALIGTTITPFMQVFVQSSVVEKANGRRRFAARASRCDRRDVLRLYDCGFYRYFDRRDACTHKELPNSIPPRPPPKRSTPIAGVYAKYLFAVGLFGAAMLAMGVLPLATAYSLSEALGFEKGLSHSFREAPIFLGIFTTLIVFGADRRADSGHSANQTSAFYAVHQRHSAAGFSCRDRLALEQQGDYGRISQRFYFQMRRVVYHDCRIRFVAFIDWKRQLLIFLS